MEWRWIKYSYKLKQNERIHLESSQTNAQLDNVSLTYNRRTKNNLDDMNRVGCIEIVS